MNRIASNKPQTQTATVLEFKRPVNALTQKSQAEIEEIDRQNDLNLYRTPIIEFCLSDGTTKEDMVNVLGFIQHLKQNQTAKTHPHLSIVQ